MIAYVDCIYPWLEYKKKNTTQEESGIGEHTSVDGRMFGRYRGFT